MGPGGERRTAGEAAARGPGGAQRPEIARPGRVRRGASGPQGLLLAAVAALALIPEVASAGPPVWCHRIRRGDTLFALARRYDTSVRELRRLNPLRRDSRLLAGRTLTLPALVELRRGRLGLAPEPLRARPGDVQHENLHADRLGLSRMRDLRMVERFVRAGLLVPVPEETRTYWVAGVPAALRVARPWTKRFIEQLARGFHELFGGRLKVTSLTRTAEVQRVLRARNINAAPARGRAPSAHLTGATVDISKSGLAGPAIAWLRHVLGRLAREHRVLHAIEEFREPHFHLMVFRHYPSFARTLASPILIGGC
ncbi:MAG: LysM peptidoglycan-binding domain-containing protein [Deltaproteobacteria bacterium]|nr:LysM peptidoglycan-binding domain-containing protein [Deltaproteobacteria bacterium]MBI3078624.1 LysM peptidoglycan-binding domain-containing protein [Deltaproteobacteria bacterium]